MTTIFFDKANGFNEAEWNPIVNAYKNWQGKGECVFRKPTRTPKQNDTIHALFEDMATEMNGIGIDLAFGKFKASWTASLAKDFFKQCYLGGKKTSECTTKEIADATDKVMHDLNSLGAQLAIKEL